MSNPLDAEPPKSKSQLKRDAHALLELSIFLVKLQQKQLDKIPLNEYLLDAVNTARKITAHGGLKRQQQYIAKLLRNLDTTEITNAIQQIQAQSSQINSNFKATERWRDRLISETKPALQEFIDAYPNVDRQILRQLIRNSKKEVQEEKPPKYYRDLFRLLRKTIEQQVTHE